jgi:cytochrome c553
LWVAILCTVATIPAQANPALDAGRAAFTGQRPLEAMMPGHREALPPTAARCSNCHAAPGLPTVGNGSFGPGLSAATLMQALPRRGGPPSRYDAEALCRALREGVDPAGVMLGAAMPRYRIDDLGCRQLWTLLTSDLR